jgi:hypothetical protein
MYNSVHWFSHGCVLERFVKCPKKLGEISASHSSEYVDDSLVGYYTK